MSTLPNVPEDEGPVSYETSSVPRWIVIVFVIVFVLLGYLLYASYTSRTKVESDLAKARQQDLQLQAQLDQTNARIADMKGELQVTSQKLGLTRDELARARTLAQTIRQEQKASDEKLVAQIGQVQRESDAKIGQVSTDVTAAKGDIKATREDLEATKAKLTSTIGDLGVQSGLIARNHEELETLKLLGERNIYEFDLRRTKTPTRLGPIQVILRKADPKRYKYTLTVIADDKAIEKKDKTVDEPVQFYVKGARAPYEIVVFQVAKNRVTGYLSTPKEAAPPAKAATQSPQ